MKKYKTVYLIKTSSQPAAPLKEVSNTEWYEIVKESNKLPKAERRYFIIDSIIDGGYADRIVIEVSEPEYKKWDAVRKAKVREFASAMDYDLVSFESAVVNGVPLAETLLSSEDVSEDGIYDLLLQELRAALADWNSWGPDLLAKYLNDEQRKSTAWLAEKCGVSEKQARIYRKRFDEFIKNFLS